MAVTGLLAKYKIMEIAVRPAAEYAAHQDFQNVVIGAQPFYAQEEMRRLFDTKKIYEKNMFPVLLVVENNNDFALRIRGDEVFLIGDGGVNIPPIPWIEVLLRISLKKPLTSYSTRKEILVRQVVEPEMLADFERKAFGERLIAPHDKDFGVLFFPYPDEDADLSTHRLYLPEVLNLTDDEPLMFFEFPLQGAPR